MKIVRWPSAARPDFTDVPSASSPTNRGADPSRPRSDAFASGAALTTWGDGKGPISAWSGTALRRDALVALQSGASSFLPAGVRRETRSDRGSDFCEWLMKARRKAASRMLKSPGQFQTFRRTSLERRRASLAVPQGGESVSATLALLPLQG